MNRDGHILLMQDKQSIKGPFRHHFVTGNADGQGNFSPSASETKALLFRSDEKLNWFEQHAFWQTTFGDIEGWPKVHVSRASSEHNYIVCADRNKPGFYHEVKQVNRKSATAFKSKKEAQKVADELNASAGLDLNWMRYERHFVVVAITTLKGI